MTSMSLKPQRWGKTINMVETDPSTVEESSDDTNDSKAMRNITNVLKTTSLYSPRFMARRPIAIPSSQRAKMDSKTLDTDLAYHNTLFPTDDVKDKVSDSHREEIKTTPLFSADVLMDVLKREGSASTKLLPQYGLLAKVLDKFEGDLEREASDLFSSASRNLSYAFGNPVQAPLKEPDDTRLFLNMNPPWSAFICGSQGSGKSHTLSCMLENALMPSKLGKLPNPLAGIVFHYDKFTGFGGTQVCEAAYLASAGIPVKVLVSPSNIWRMTNAYENLPGFPEDATPPMVAPLLLSENQLNVERMMKLMAVDEKEGKMALYMESVCKILRSMAQQNRGGVGVNFDEFKIRLTLERLNDGQMTMLNMRLQLLESFLHSPEKPGATPTRHHGKKPHFENTKEGREIQRKWYAEQDARMKAEIAKSGIWLFEPGTLTIVDLSCPFVDEGAACAMFNICLAIFLENRGHTGRIVALDEAHKFMTTTDSSTVFTESLLSVIRQQRHLATRVIIATQEPTISPALLDLSSMTIVHRFTSPSWMAALKEHLAGASTQGDATKRDVAEIFERIVNLKAGEALLFSPSAMMGVEESSRQSTSRMKKLGMGYVKIIVRKRLTADGGRSILAT